MQHPVGYTIRNGRAELTDFAAVVFQKWAILQFIHTVSGAYILSAFFVMGISAYHLLKKQHIDFFNRSFKMALVFGLIFSLVTAIEGDLHAKEVAKTQPAKLAAMETLWETTSKAPIYMFTLPDEKNERNFVEIIPIPGLLSFLAFGDPNAEVQGLKEFPRDERPPVLITSFAFKGMVGLGTYFVFITILGWFLRNRLVQSPVYLIIMLFSIPLPYIANELGWVLAEVGRQPWIVYGLMKTSDAVSPVATSQVFMSLIAFIAFYGLLGAAGFYIIAKHAHKGPDIS
jgi:cytochrome d ubiquinol oxidase subunit I